MASLCEELNKQGYTATFGMSVIDEAVMRHIGRANVRFCGAGFHFRPEQALFGMPLAELSLSLHRLERAAQQGNLSDRFYLRVADGIRACTCRTDLEAMLAELWLLYGEGVAAYDVQ